jgi:hypothetical protein
MQQAIPSRLVCFTNTRREHVGIRAGVSRVKQLKLFAWGEAVRALMRTHARPLHGRCAIYEDMLAALSGMIRIGATVKCCKISE